MQAEPIGFIRFNNAYTEKQRRIKLSSIIEYWAYGHTELGESYYKSYVKDIGETGYSIDIDYAYGGHKVHTRVYFWTKQQRDETLDQLELTPEPQVKVINPRYDKIPDGSATIQDLPTL